ncbi:6-bladed beta-propeller [Sphingobacterium puteale]|uniref:6-bladed beta-propeller n=1 Tax=Sphingobacterium puteale TaxID=2420510 RepID=UPI003D95FF73
MKYLSVTAIILFFIFLGWGCSNSVNRNAVNQRSDLRLLKIQPDQLLSLRTSDFLDSVKFIPLETTPESEFAEISQIEIIDSLYLILDRMSNQILFFKKDGKFVRRISPKNRDIPVPYHSIAKFSLDPNRKILSFLDQQKPNVYEFDFFGNFLKMRDKKPIDYNIREFYHLGKYTINYFSYESRNSNTNSSPTIVVNEGEKEIDSYLFFDPSTIYYNDMYDARKYFFRSKENLLFSRPGDYTVYEFDKKGKINRYVDICLPEKFKLPEDFLTNKQYSNKRRKYLDSSRSKVYLITDFYKAGDMLSCRLIGSRYKSTFLYSLRSEVAIDFRNYLSDSSTFFLPIANNTVLGVDCDSYISSVSASQIIQAITRNIKIQGYLSSLPDHLNTLYKKGNNQNPILTLIKPKSIIVYDDKK